MVKIIITPDLLSLEVLGSHKFWALKSLLDIPLDHVRAVRADPHPAMGWFQGFKVAGADIPHIFRAGMFYQDGDKIFWDVRHAARTIVIDLEDETCAKLIVEVKDPEAAVQEIQKAIDDYAASKRAAEAELHHYLQHGVDAPVVPEVQTQPAVEEPEQIELKGS